MSNSNQNIATPQIFVNAVASYFNIKFKYDMAASQENTKCEKFFTEKDNSLAIDWPTNGWCWLNPPFKHLTKWINKCNEQKNRGCKIFSIWHLSGDSNQIVTWSNASIYIIHGRIWPEVRGIMLCEWNNNKRQNVQGFIWNKTKLSMEWTL
jgi:phage N-6-adenine-methyltransferase